MEQGHRDGCVLCQIIEGQIPSYKIYEDEHCVAILDVNGAQVGHTFIIPKKHYAILEQLPESEIGHLLAVANDVSSAIFENLGVQGTNVFVTNGIPAGQTVAHFMIHVIPRSEGDGIQLTWEPKQLSQEELSTVELKIKDQIENIGISTTNAPPTTAQSSSTAAVMPGPLLDDLEEDYFEKQIRRSP